MVTNSFADDIICLRKSYRSVISTHTIHDYHSYWKSTLVAPEKPKKGKRRAKNAPQSDPDAPKPKRVVTQKYDSDRAFFEWFKTIPSRLKRLIDTRIARWHKVAQTFTDAGLHFITSSMYA